MKDGSDTRKIPKDWEFVKLGDDSIADLIMGQSPPSSTYNDKGIGLPFLQGNAEFGETYPAPILSCSQPIKIAEKNDILLSVRAPVGDINITSSKSCIGRGLAAIRPKHDKLDHLFLFYYLKFGSRKFESLSMGSTFKAIRKEEVVKFQIPLPPLPEQRRIAEVLGTVDSAIQKVGGAIESTERLKKGLMQRLLTRGIGHERFKFSKEFGCEFPEEWKVINLGRATEIIMGQSPPGDTYNTSMNGIHLINGPAEFGEKYPIPNKWTSEPTKITKKNDVLICVRGHTTGRLNISDKEFCIGRGVAAIRNLPDATNNIFLYYILDWMRNKIFGISYAAGSIFPNINRDQLNKLDIPLPPLPEQRRIADILSAVDRKLELERRRREKLERVKKGLMNELLTGRKRIKVENDGNIY